MFRKTCFLTIFTINYVYARTRYTTREPTSKRYGQLRGLDKDAWFQSNLQMYVNTLDSYIKTKFTTEKTDMYDMLTDCEAVSKSNIVSKPRVTKALTTTPETTVLTTTVQTTRTTTINMAEYESDYNDSLNEEDHSSATKQVIEKSSTITKRTSEKSGLKNKKNKKKRMHWNVEEKNSTVKRKSSITKPTFASTMRKTTQRSEYGEIMHAIRQRYGKTERASQGTKTKAIKRFSDFIELKYSMRAQETIDRREMKMTKKRAKTATLTSPMEDENSPARRSVSEQEI